MKTLISLDKNMKRNAVLLCTIATLGMASLNSGCSSDNRRTGEGAGIGAAAGALAGAVIGHQTGNRMGGALIGGALGAGIGGLVGNRLDKQAKELATVAETKRTEQGVVSKLKSDILFDTGKSDLKASADENLTKMAGIMKKYPENVLTVKGYTDNTGSKAINEKLSTARADAVKQELVKGGIPADTISIVGMADADPVAPNTTTAGRSQNRRVEIEIVADPSKLPENAKADAKKNG